ncbi:MAG: diacylglycerol/polyprenol kinase family protein [Candidatus Micrarchaeia archaeon]
MVVLELVLLALLLAYRIYIDAVSKRWEVYSYLFFALGFLLFEFEDASAAPLYLLLLILFNIVSTNYGSKKSLAFSVLLLFAILLSINGLLFAQSAFMGIFPGVIGLKSKSPKKDKALEIRRDAVHLLAGIIILFIASFFYFWAREAITVLIILGFALGNYTTISKDRIALFLRSFERRNTKFGSGAIWLSLGILIAIGFIFPNGIMQAVLAAILVGDPLATIIGIKFGMHKLPYNKEKSLEGTIAYFAATSILSYIFIGFAGIAIALIAAFIESWNIKIDDNFLVSFVLALFLLVLFYF